MKIQLEFPDEQKADIIVAFKSLERKPLIRSRKDEDQESKGESDEDFLSRRLTLYVNAHTKKFKEKQ